MSRIIRVDKRENYTVLDNGFVNDDRLSWQATGMLTYLLSKPNHWSVSIADLVNRKTNGRSSVMGLLRELEEAGYLDRTRARGKDGQFVCESVVREQPSLNINGDSSESHQCRLSDADKPTRIIAPVVNTEEVNTEKKKAKPAPARMPELPADWPAPLHAAWEDFAAMRREKHKPLTATSVRLLLAKIDKWGHSRSAVALRNSAENGWQGVFEPQGSFSDSPRPSKPPQAASGIATPPSPKVRIFE